MKVSKRELPEAWAEKIWLTLDFWMLRSHVSRRDFDVDALEEVVSMVRSIPTFKAYCKAVRRDTQRHGKRTYPHAVPLFRVPPAGQILAHTFDLRRLLAQWQREALPRTEPE
ncbi:hypothetical protein B0G80_7539 [Paraburkholderia sp. BL6669N2]|uniref:hypothetical protein n=1 Tax=Paraburkholderia sp. BL6669N2 TaxID=1938807 RepID=UPI000E24C574|nr:hypothetical protein [Paraburkholderia sp. BL6669N2]REG51055.1 hypothetical protein B0G80_7539 [Paraburkholderia sp. BL6669N2]